MRLLIITSSFPRNKGDYHGNFVYYHALGQVQRGTEVHVVCPHTSGALLHENMDGIIIHRFPYFYPYRLQKVSSNTGMYSGLKNSKLAIFQLPLFLVSEFLYTLIIIQKYKIDLVHSHWIIPSGMIGANCKRFLNKPHIISSHVLDANLFGKYRIFLPVLTAITSTTDLLCVDSTYNKEVIEKLVKLPKSIRVIPMGVNLPPVSASSQKKEIIVLFVGRLIEWKGVDTLIRAMVQVIRVIPDAKLYVVGEGPFRIELEELVKNLVLTESVVFNGRISDERLAVMYECASVHVLPSREYKGLVMEGLGVVLLEAMARGVPVIGSNTGGITDIIQDGYNGFLFPYDDDDQLAQKIVELLSNKTLADQFRQRGYETVRTKFSWDAISEKFSAAYLEIFT